jgi:DNA adenine methylase
MAKLRAPFPWFGGKSLAAPLIWRAFGNVPNFVEPFAGSLATLLARPHTPKVETVNDLDGLIANFWRATAAAPDEVARWADWPVNEADLHARHRWLVDAALPLTEALMGDPEYYDAKVAGWWVWGICTWIGNGWCSRDERLKLHHCLPKVSTPGHGIHAPSRKKPLTHRNKGVHRSGAGELEELFGVLAHRLRHVRVCCGDWTRILGRSTLGIDSAHGMTPCGVLLDPPYAHGAREKRLYRHDDAELSGVVRAWALEHGENPQLRIALCGWDGEHAMLAGWTQAVWKSKGSGKNRGRERIWFSPHCLPAVNDGELFAARGEASTIALEVG